MKTPYSGTGPITTQIPRPAPATVMGGEALQRMKISLWILFVILCGMFTTTAVFSQTITWNGVPGTTWGTNFGVGTNWLGNNGATPPAATNTPITGSICVFNGTAAGIVNVVSQDGINHAGSGAPIGGSFGASGTTINIQAGQTSPVNIFSPVSTSVGWGFNGIQVDAGAGQLTIGDNTANQLACTLRPSSGLHTWINNSANPVIINPNMQINNGGGSNGHEIDFQGTGNWAITNNLRFNNGSFPELLNWDSTGTTIWAAGGANDHFNTGLGAITINSGTVIITSAGLIPNTAGANTIANNATLTFDGTAQSDTIIRAISGSGTLQVNNGQWTFTGASTYTGNTVLNGGEFIVNGGETPGTSGPLGVGGTILFSGGTLAYGVNSSFDYSPRFSNGASQAYSIDTGGQNVTYTNALTSSGGTFTKIGAGSLTLAGANTYGGLTTVSVGKLVIAGTAGSGSVTVADGAAFGVVENGTAITLGTLTLGSSTGATLEFNNVTNPVAAPLAPATVSSAGTAIININSGTFRTIGQTFPLLSWTSGSAPGTSLGSLAGAAGHLLTNGNSIVLVIDQPPFLWSGANNGTWDAATMNNWLLSGSPVVWTNGNFALFDDTLASNNLVTISGVVSANANTITFGNNNTNYTVTSSSGNDIGGASSLTMAGNGTTTLTGGANTYTGVTTISRGILSVGALANGGSASDIGAAASSAANLVLNGGTLQYTGSGAGIDRLFTLGAANGAIDASGSGALVLNNTGTIAMSSSGPRTLTLTGTNTSANTLTANFVNPSGGAAALTKSGTGTWALTGTNTYSGLTTIAGGELQIGAGGGNGTFGSGNIVDDGSIDLNRAGALTISSVISGTGSVTNDGPGTVILTANNSYSGGTTINAGTLQIGNGGATGSLSLGGNVVDNGTLAFNSTATFVLTASVSGTGNVMVSGSGKFAAEGNNSYTGWTLINSGATFQPCYGNSGQLLSSVVTNNGTLLFLRQDATPAVFGYSNNIVGTGRLVKDNNNQNYGEILLDGTNTYTGDTFIAGGGIVLGDGVTPGAGTIVGNVWFTNTASGNLNLRQLIFNRPDNFTFTNPIITKVTDGSSAANSGALEQIGPNVVTLVASNSYLGATTISNGVLQVGNGGTTGNIGTGAINIGSGTLVFDRSDNLTLANGFGQGAGSLVQFGAGSLAVTLNGTNSYGGPTIVSNGTLSVSGSVGGDLDVNGGTLIPGAAGTVSTLTVLGNMNVTNGTVVAYLNKSLASSNSVFSIAVTNPITGTSNAVTYISGTLKLVNNGPVLKAGDYFQIFSQGVTNGGAMAIVPPLGVTSVANNLAVDGSVTVTGALPAPALIASVSGTNLNLSWPSGWTGLHVQAQTNSLAKGLGTNWFAIAGTDTGNTYTAAINRTNGTVFYRLAP